MQRPQAQGLNSDTTVQWDEPTVPESIARATKSKPASTLDTESVSQMHTDEKL